ncbi:MAG TPA: DUF262 domain-containing protein [Ktedonobacterales bacterium]
MSVQARVAVEIKGEQRPVGKIFSSEFMFSVPPYQRPYAWTTEHAGVLLDDLLGFMGDGDEPAAALNPYFLGSIVLIKGADANAQIVDGQQRLITLTILLSALRSLVPPQIAANITSILYEPDNPLLGLPARFRLEPKPQDAAFFRDYIQREGRIADLRAVGAATLSDSKRNMRDNALLYVDRLRLLAADRLIRLAQFVVQRCLLIVVTTPDLDSAYRIFSVLNDRGLDLSFADILKAEVIGQIQEDGAQRQYTAKWEDTEEELGRRDFEALLSHIRMLYRKQKQHETVLEEFRKYVIAPAGSSQHLIDTVLLPYAAAYATISDESYQHTNNAEPVNTHLRWLNRIPDADWLPPAMLYLANNRNDPARLARFFTDLERLAASLMLRRAGINKRIERYAGLIEAIERGDNLGAASSPLQLTAEERRETLHALDGDLYLQSARIRQYVLLRLDSLLAGEGATYSYPNVSIEHVLPQNPKGDSLWVRWFPTPQLREKWVHRLANLVLLSRRKNARAANYDFDQKKRTYFAGADGVSPFAITTQVLQEQKWTPQALEQRQQELVGKLKQLWRL